MNSEQFIPGIYRQHILAVVIAGHQPVDIDTHGGGTGAEGSHITATKVIWISCVVSVWFPQVERDLGGSASLVSRK